MPFHTHSHHHGPNTSGSQPGAAAGIYQAAQALGSIGAPTGNLRVATSGQTAAGTDSLLPSSGNVPGYSGGGQVAGNAGTILQGSGRSAPNSTDHAAITNSSQLPSQHDTSRRSHPGGRNVEDLLTSGSGNGSIPGIGQHGIAHSSQQHLYDSPSEYTQRSAQDHMSFASTQSSQYSSSRQDTGIPGALQAGGTARPGPSSAYTAPTTVPTMPQISTNAQHYSLPSRSNTINSSHAHSRSSPAGLEQKYIPFSNTAGTPDTPKYVPSQNQKYYSTPQTPTGAMTQPPLALADIRPRASNMEDSGGALFDELAGRLPTNSNYVAPWAAYAYDWCKWPVAGGNTAGKMAIGSYLEDPHNFVRSTTHLSRQVVELYFCE